MRELGLVVDAEIEIKNNKMRERKQLEYDQALKNLEMERTRAEEKAELMRKKASMGNTPALDL